MLDCSGCQTFYSRRILEKILWHISYILINKIFKSFFSTNYHSVKSINVLASLLQEYSKYISEKHLLDIFGNVFNLMTYFSETTPHFFFNTTEPLSIHTSWLVLRALLITGTHFEFNFTFFCGTPNDISAWKPRC